MAEPSGGVAGMDRVTVMLAVLTCVLLGVGVADISRSLVSAIVAGALITTGLVIALAILRLSS
ncbi:hypothetical protein HGA13_07565 [Nocardia speluncae]|uniref:Uncharacterized protein n=1 Tax=Nocardia speluncae TaxID=419477 RepID=A0A846XDW7_9NOCA|nr:hypothetical protein [Nocardia speluncae]NKY32930.1 hypothetical protein [Nocardia speluncae]